MNEEIAIRVEHVSKAFKLPHEKNTSIKSAAVNFYKRKRTFERQEVLRDISFEIKKGEFLGIVGRNGSGKSTLLKLLAGIYSPNKGSIQTNGKLTPFIELGVGFNPELTGRENVFLNGALMGFNRKEMLEMYSDIVEFAELERFMDQKLKNYSSGMQVRLAFSIAIRARGDILLLDEVLAVGDEAFQKKCDDYFQKVKNGQQTVILVTHDMKAVAKYCDRAILLSEGELKLIGNPNTVAEAYNEINRYELNKQPHELIALEDSVQAEARVKQVITKDPKFDRNKTQFAFSDTIEITASYELVGEVDDGVIDIGIKLGKDGPYYFYTNTLEHKIKVTGKKGDILKIVCTLPNIFNAGTFYIATSLYNQKTLKVYARERASAKFQTTSLPIGGLVHPQHKLTFTGGL